MHNIASLSFHALIKPVHFCAFYVLCSVLPQLLICELHASNKNSGIGTGDAGGIG